MSATAATQSPMDAVRVCPTPAVMRAAVYRRFGGPDVVRIEPVPTPVPRAGEVLVRVGASTVSAADHRSRAKDIPRGLALPSALVLGLFRPRIEVLGMDVCGVVEAVAADVTKFAVGDEVVAMLGTRFGGHAEYVTIPEDGAIALKPVTLGVDESAALVFGGITARAFLSRAPISEGTTVLVNGASGAVGSAAVQLAKMAGAHVTAVTSARNAGLVSSIGADRVIDYAAADFTADGHTYDVILDAVGNAPFARVRRIIAPGGALLQVVADLGEVILAAGRSRRTGTTIVAGTVSFTADDLAAVVEAAEAGWYRPVIDRTLDLADIADAHRHVDTGRKRGAVVVRMGNPTQCPTAAGGDAQGRS